MSPRKKIEIQTPDDAAEGWESLAEEPSGGTLEPNPELEAALREAAEALDERGAVAKPAEGDSAPVAAADGAGAAADPATASGDTTGGMSDQEAQERLLRLQADFENFRRRALREKTEAHQYGHQNLVKDLLSTVDNLDRAIEHSRQSGGGDLESLLQGVELVQRELLGALAKNGVIRIEALGNPFDPALHEAMAQAPDASVAPNTVIDELQKGYKLRDRLLRPARVVVARPPDEASGDNQEGG